MKFFATLLLALSPFTSQAFMTNACGEGRVPSALNGICIQVNRYIEGCDQYKNQNSCAKCFSSYYLSSEGLCEYSGLMDEPNNLVGCLQQEQVTVKGQTTKKCMNCANGFIRVNGNCQKGVRDCAKYNTSSKKCEQCQQNYSLILGECRHNYLLGCRNQNADHTCNQCLKPFTLSEAHCSIPNCKNFNDFGCIACECGYFLTENRSCKEIKEGCLRYNRGSCINCLPHYKLKGGICQIEGCQKYSGNICEQCNSELYDRDANKGGCTFRNCFEWHDNKCLLCNEGYKRTEKGICQKAMENACKMESTSN